MTICKSRATFNYLFSLRKCIEPFAEKCTMATQLHDRREVYHGYTKCTTFYVVYMNWSQVEKRRLMQIAGGFPTFGGRCPLFCPPENGGHLLSSHVELCTITGRKFPNLWEISRRMSWFTVGMTRIHASARLLMAYSWSVGRTSPASRKMEFWRADG